MADSEARLKDVLVRGLGGDADVYHAFLSELSSHLRGFFRKRLTQMPDAVEDILQETLIAVHNQRHTYSPEYPLTAWVHAIAKYKLADFLRRYARQDALSDSLDEVGDVLSVSDAAAHDARRDINELLLQLPDRQRLPLMHVKIEGMSVIETATLTGMSVSAVKVGIHRGLKALAAKLRDSS